MWFIRLLTQNHSKLSEKFMIKFRALKIQLPNDFGWKQSRFVTEEQGREMAAELNVTIIL